MDIIKKWEFFLESIRNPDDMVNIFKITANFEPHRSFNTYSVMSLDTIDSCITTHTSQILNKDYNPNSGRLEGDEMYFYNFVRGWIQKNGSDYRNKEAIKDRITVEKITEERIPRMEANRIKVSRYEEDKKNSEAFRQKNPFSTNELSPNKNQSSIEVSESEKLEKQKKNKFYLLRSQSTKRLKELISQEALSFEPNKDSTDYPVKIIYWSGIYSELYGILNDGSWMWMVSGTPTAIEKHDIDKYKLKIPRVSILADQLQKIEFDKEKKSKDLTKYLSYDRDQLLGNDEQIMDNDLTDKKGTKVLDRKFYILNDGEVRIPKSQGNINIDNVKISFTNQHGEKLKVQQINNRSGGEYFLYYSTPDNKNWRQILNVQSIQKLINFIDSEKSETNISNILFTKLDKKIYREITPEYTDLYEFLLKFNK